MTEKMIKPIIKDKGNPVLVMKIMDGHFTDETWWRSASSDASFHHYEMLEALGGENSSCLEINQNGKVWQDFILNSLPPKVRRKGPGSDKYIEVKYLYRRNCDYYKHVRRRIFSSAQFRKHSSENSTILSETKTLALSSSGMKLERR